MPNSVGSKDHVLQNLQDGIQQCYVMLPQTNAITEHHPLFIQTCLSHDVVNGKGRALHKCLSVKFKIK